MPANQANQIERERWNDPFWSEHWPKRERFTESVTPLLMKALALKPGDSVLDIGCGGGPATRAAAAIVGNAGKVVGADISAPLAELARKRAAASGAKNMSFQVRDVQQDRVDGGPFDVAMSQFGVMFFDEPKTAFANIRTHLVRGGRLGFACWQAVAKNPWFIGPLLADFVPPPPQPLPGKSPTGPFVFADPGYVRNILQTSGFADIGVANHDVSVEAPENAIIDDAQLMHAGVPPERMPQARAVVDKHMTPFRLTAGLCRFPLAVQIFTARNPPS
jgi:SAM-dependent methyltransferase